MWCPYLFFISTFLLFVNAQNESTAVPCSLCASLFPHDKLDCPADSPPGCAGDLVTCPCRFDCRNITLRCEEKGNWTPLPSNGPYCLPEKSYNNAVMGEHRRVSYTHTRGLYTFECETGFTLQGFAMVTCANNVLNEPFPQCVEGGNTVTETTTLFPTIENITISQNKGPETMIAITTTTIEPTTIIIRTPTMHQITSEEIITIIPIQKTEIITEFSTIVDKFTTSEIKRDPIQTTTIKPNVDYNISTTSLPYKETEESSSLGLIIIIGVLGTFVLTGTIIGIYFYIQRRKQNIAKEKALKRMSKIIGPNMYNEAHDHDTSYLKYLSMVDANFMLNTEDKESETDFNEHRNESDVDQDVINLPRISIV